MNTTFDLTQLGDPIAGYYIYIIQYWYTPNKFHIVGCGRSNSPIRRERQMYHSDRGQLSKYMRHESFKDNFKIVWDRQNRYEDVSDADKIVEEIKTTHQVDQHRNHYLSYFDVETNSSFKSITKEPTIDKETSEVIRHNSLPDKTEHRKQLVEDFKRNYSEPDDENLDSTVQAFNQINFNGE